MPNTPDARLTAAQRQHFLEHGWIRIEDAVPHQNIARFADDVWVRLGYDPDDKTTWTKEKIHMPRHRQMPTKEFMPKAWDAICDLVGGEERIDPTLFETCGDSLIVNLGTDEWENKEIAPRSLGNWHIDGDWFTHYLDSGEQALTVIVLFSDIMPRAGGTYIAPDGIRNVVQWLYDHPEGADSFSQDPDGSRSVCSIHHCQEFVELTGKAGDVILLHPFMPHSASKNHLRKPRLITNPPVTLKQPFYLNRSDPSDYSLVEQKILKELGMPNVGSWSIAGPRKRFAPRTRAGKDALIMEEVARLKAHAQRTGGEIDSMHAEGPVPYLTVV